MGTPTPYRLQVSGHVTQERLAAHIHTIEMVFASCKDGRVAILVDLRAMTGYDIGVRNWFRDVWALQYGSKVDKIAVVATKSMWRLMVATLNIRTHFSMKAFESEFDAEVWLKDPLI